VLGHLRGDKWLTASLMYGSGLRLMECLRLRVQDIDFARNEIMVRSGRAHETGARCCPSHSSPRCETTSRR
jgi:integrase